mgnify:CR=1 FL=1|tara:strand:- start:337 stop:759 length:423 start_codon:yes stop_codon:yes gene_type:complete
MRFILLLLLSSLTLSLSSFTSEVSLHRVSNILKQVETSGKINVIGDSGKAFGILQIHKICIDDVNRVYGTSYRHIDAFDEVCSEEIFVLYLTMGINLYCKRYNREPTERELVNFWNFGLYQKQYDNGYYNKYLKFKNITR